MIDRQVVAVDARTWPIGNIETRTTESTKDGAVSVVPRLSDAQQVDVTVTAKFNDIVEYSGIRKQLTDGPYVVCESDVCHDGTVICEQQLPNDSHHDLCLGLKASEVKYSAVHSRSKTAAS